jgi:hypothetical protein
MGKKRFYIGGKPLFNDLAKESPMSTAKPQRPTSQALRVSDDAFTSITPITANTPATRFGTFAKGVTINAHPTAATISAISDGVLGLVDRIVYYKLEAQRIEAETQRIRLQANLMSQAIEREFDLRMAELETRRQVLLQQCQHAHFDQQTMRQHLHHKQAQTDRILQAALARDTPAEEKQLLLKLYTEENAACTALLQLIVGQFKERVTALLSAPALPTHPTFRLEN